MRRALCRFAGLVLLVLPTAARAQGVHVGGFVGYSFVGGADSRVASNTGLATVTGAGRNGLHLRGFVDLPVSQSALAFRGELFYNRLTSAGNTAARLSDGSTAQSALVDRSIGVTGSLVATTSRTAVLAPYFSFGAGLFTTMLGYNPDPAAARATQSQRGMGMGMGLVAGGGLRWRVGRPTLLLDWRYFQALNNTRGSAFMPVAVGVSF